MRDFTLSVYSDMLDAAVAAGYECVSFSDVIRGRKDEGRWVVFRHDVDLKPWNSVATAKLESEKGIRGSYYFRVVRRAWDVNAIGTIADLGHECGYHYEDLDLARGDIKKAYKLFEEHLKRLRSLVPVETACMHGSPLSNWDNRDIWQTYSYRGCGIIGEPYFDLDFDRVFYLTDTGRSWNNRAVSVRDKVDSGFDITVSDTCDIIDLFRSGDMPDRVMINIHPQRWNDGLFPWVTELVIQKGKNYVKKWMYVGRNGK